MVSSTKGVLHFLHLGSFERGSGVQFLHLWHCQTIPFLEISAPLVLLTNVFNFKLP